MTANDFLIKMIESFVVIFIWEDIDLKKTRIMTGHSYTNVGMNIHKIKSKEELFNEFNLHCKARNLSPKTLEYYYFCWQSFMRFLEKENIPLENINLNYINAYIVYLREDNTKNDISISTRTRGIRTILYYFMERDYIQKLILNRPRKKKKY